MPGNEPKKPGLLWSVLTCRCPRCRRGKLFSQPNPYSLKHNMDMPSHCPVCGQVFELHTGFYFGTGYVSYGFAVAISVITLVFWWLSFGISFRDNSVFYWLIANTVVLIAMQPLLQRLARAVWIAFFVRYDPPKQTPNP